MNDVALMNGQIQEQTGTVSDLFSADAVYHKGCYSRFIVKLPHTPNKVKCGIPKRNMMQHLLLKIYARN